MGFDSLVIANTVELLGGGVASTNPRCPGAVFRLQPGGDPGAPQPTTNFVASLLLDGERPFGRRASNRTIKLPVWITAPNRQILAAAREVLQQAVDQDYFTITWTRDPAAGNPGGTALPMVLDCFRAQPTVAVFNTMYERQSSVLGMQVQLTIPALPYARSDTQVQVAFAAPVPTTPFVPPPPSPVVLDAYDTISSTQCSQSSQCVIGPTSCVWDPDFFGDPGGQVTALTYSKTFPSALNLFGMTSLQFWLGFGSRYYCNLEYLGKCHGVAISFTLTDTAGHTLSFSRSNLVFPVAPTAQSPIFTRVSIPIPQTSSTFNYASVASYSVKITNRNDNTVRLSWVTAYLDALTAYPGSQQQILPIVRGAVYTLYGVQGTARAPVTMSFQQPPSPGTATTVTTPGVGTYTVPANASYIKVECWGGGGAGATMTASGVGAGGGGGEYAAENVYVTSANSVIPYIVGAGDTTNGSTYGGAGSQTVFGPTPGGVLQVIANGGQTAANNTDVAEAGGTGSANAVHHPGGASRANAAGTALGGGGGSSGGPSFAGLSPQGTGSITFTTPGTNTWLCPAGVTSVFVECWGAGGGGGSGGTSGSNGGGGGGGEYAAANVPVTPGNSYTYIVGSGGAGGVSQGNGATGFASQFTGDGGYLVLAHAGAGGLGTSWLGNPGSGGAGGSGGFGTAVHPGGLGGPAYPYTGGGGSSAGPGAAGNTGGGPAGAVAPQGGGSGGSGTGNASGTGGAGVQPGGGGGGSHLNTFNGGAGANGEVRISYPVGIGAPTNAGASAVTGGGAGGAGATSVSTPGMPASATNVTNSTGFPVSAIITGGTISSVKVNGVQVGTTAGTYTVPNGQTISITYTVAPTWTWVAQGITGSGPGGGGGGGYNSGTGTSLGGNGANGQIVVTPYVPAAFKSLIVHRPPLGTLKTFQPMVSVGAGADVPDGTHQYNVPQPVTGVNADFGGTFTVYLINALWNGSGSRTITVTVNQYEYAGGPSYSASTLPVTLTPSQVTNGIVLAGVLTLPVKAVAHDNLGGYYTVSVTDTNLNDRFYDCLFLDTMGQTVVINEPSTSYLTYYIDPPDPNVSLGRIMGSNGGRGNAISVMDHCDAISGGPLHVEPADGDNLLFVYSADGGAPPNVALSYFPAYFFDRTQ